MRIVILLVFCLYPITGFAQVIFFNHVSQEDGLRNGNIRTIAKDYQGFMWIGTEDGLHRYDGYEMKIYRNVRGDSSSLGSNFILCIFEDSHRNLWVGTLEGGLYRYNRKKDSFQKFTLPSRTGVAVNVAIRCITEGADHFLYVGSDNLVSAKIDSTKSMVFSPVKLPTDTLRTAGIRITAMTQSTDAGLLISVSTQGLFVYNHASGQCSPHAINSLEKDVQAIYVDKRRNLLWIGSWKNGLLIYDPAGKRHKRITSGQDAQSLRSNFLSAIAGDASGDIWIATDNGVNVVPHDVNPFEKMDITTFLASQTDPSGIRGVAFKALYVDDHEKVWIGSYYEGLNVYDKNAMNFGSVDVARESKTVSGPGNVNALQEDDEANLWIGLDGGGLYRMRGEFNGMGNATLKRIPLSDKVDKVKALEIDQDHNLWLGSWADGLWTLDGRTLKGTKVNTSIEMGANIISLESDGVGNLWVGSFDRGLFRYDHKNGTAEKIQGVEPNLHSFDRIHALFADSIGNLWIGKEAGGLNLLKKGERLYKTIYTTHLDRSATITTIFQDRSGMVWVGVPALGLIAYDPSVNQSYLFGEEAGLANSSIYAIQEDDSDRLWISHNAGLSAFNKKTKRFINFTRSNGITANQFNKNSSVKRKSGQIVFGNIHALNYFNPNHFRETTTHVPIVFTKFLINNIAQKPGEGVLQENITTTRTISLKHNQNSFSIEFAALHYQFSHQAEYYYKLDDFENSWQYAGNRKLISYTNLPPGEYTCEVRMGDSTAAHRSGAFGQLHIIIVPAWWQTTFFKVALFIILMLSIFILHRLRVHFLVHQRNRLESEVRARTRDLNETVEEVNAMNTLLQAQQHEIVEKSNEIQSQNEELLSQNEHIAEQHDILMEAQQQLRQINLQLEKTVEQRTETLQHTIDNLNKVVFELDRFVYSASHDLSAPLKSILGLVHIINMEHDPVKVKEYVDLIKYTVFKLDAVIKSMVDYARNSHMDVTTKKIGLRGLMEESVTELTFLPEAAGISFQNQVPDNLFVQNDPMRLKVVFSNLITNSVKYHDKNKEKRWIRMEASRIDDKWIHVKITDNGIGIRAEFIDKIFNMYFRATELSRGSGLGLFIVKEMVTKIGGQIKVTTQLGEWTIFEIRIPEIALRDPA